MEEFEQRRNTKIFSNYEMIRVSINQSGNKESKIFALLFLNFAIKKLGSTRLE